MPVFVEAILISLAMLAIFFLAFLMIFLIALFLSPIERELSKVIWAATTPPPLKPSPKPNSFRDFSKKHQ